LRQINILQYFDDQFAIFHIKVPILNF